MLHHVAIEMSPAEREEALRFWALLGFHEVDPPPSLRERAAWVQRGGTQIHLLWAERPVAPAQGHVAVVLDDFEGRLRRLRTGGFEVQPRTEHWGARRAFVRAPGGHRVEVMAAPPGG